MILRRWLPFAVLAVCSAAAIHFATHQSIRAGANDPQIETAERLARRWASGGDVRAGIGRDTVDMAADLDVFVILIGNGGDVISSNAVLHGRTPVPPSGVLDAAKTSGEQRVTWAPEPAVRIAAVVVAARDSGWVVAGRSLREAERRTGQNGELVALALGVTLVMTLAASAFAGRSGRSGG